MVNTGTPTQPAIPSRTAISPDREVPWGEIAAATDAVSDCEGYNLVPGTSADSFCGSHAPQPHEGDIAPRETDNNHKHSSTTTRASRSSAHPSHRSFYELAASDGKQSRYETFDNEYGWNEADLSPAKFTSLAEAFRASLSVVRCLRKALSLLQDSQLQNFQQREQQGQVHDGASTRLPAGILSRIADVIARQESFTADEGAYGELLRNTSAPPVSAHVDLATPRKDNALEVLDCATTPVQGIDSLSGVSTAALHLSGGTANRATSAAPLCASLAPTTSGLEYELSLCKALLLLQQLTPESAVAADGASASSCLPQSLPDCDRQTDYSKTSSSLDLIHSVTPSTKELSGPTSRRHRGTSAAVLEALLCVRLLQGTQRLLRADFMRLLHRQRKQHYQIEQAVQATIRRLESERDALLGRMHKLSTVMSRK